MLLVYTISGVKVNKKIFTRLKTVSIYIYAARVCGYILTIHLYVMYIVYLKPIYTRERIYSFSYSYSSVTFLSHCDALIKNWYYSIIFGLVKDLMNLALFIKI